MSNRIIVATENELILEDPTLEKLYDSRIIEKSEIFQIFVRNVNPNSYIWNFDLIFHKIPRNIVFKIEFAHENSQIYFFIKFDNELISIENLDQILSQGYVIDNLNRWIPIAQESADYIIENKINSKIIKTSLAIKISREQISFNLSEKLNLKSIYEQTSQNTELQSELRHKLYQYQNEGVRWLLFCFLNGTGTILADEMGLGKTAQIIGLLTELKTRKILGKALVIAPGTLLENWKREIDKFSNELKPLIHHGHDRINIAEEFSEYDVIITSYNLLVNDFHTLKRVSWDIIAFDEASMLKNPTSERAIFANDIKATCKIAITGTPLENNIFDFFTISKLVHPGGLQSLEDFKENIYYDKSTTEKFKTLTSQIMLRRKKEDVLKELPAKIEIFCNIKMSIDERNEYNKIESSALNEQNASALTVLSKLRQYTSHPQLLEGVIPLSISELSLKSVKFTRCLEILEAIRSSNEKVIIFTPFLLMIDILKKSLSELFHISAYSLDGRNEISFRQSIIDSFSEENNFSVLICNPYTAGFGLNITSANHVIHYTRQWNPAVELQATARVHRNGQTKPVNIYYLYYQNTIEDVIHRVLINKTNIANEFVKESIHNDDAIALEVLSHLKKEKNE